MTNHQTPRGAACLSGVIMLAAWLAIPVAGHQSLYPDREPVPDGPYLGQKPPGATPEIFGPGIVSTCLDELNSVFSPDGTEFYFCVRNMEASSLFVMGFADGAWGGPEPLPFAGPYDDIDVSLSPDGKSLFFCSNRPVEAGGAPKRDHDIWMCERQGEIWGPPVHLGGAVNSPRDDFFPIVTRTGNLYFNSQRAGAGTNDIYVCRREHGRFAPAEKLGPEINTDRREFDAFVAPDESFMIFSSERPEDDRFGDLYISFRTPAGGWTPAGNMGRRVNGIGPEYGTALSPDGKYLFFARQTLPGMDRPAARPLTRGDYLKTHDSPDNGSSNIWWVEAKIIEELRPRPGTADPAANGVRVPAKESGGRHQALDPEAEKDRIELALRACIGWAANKDLALLYRTIAGDPDFLEVHPDGRVVKGFEEFKKAERIWMNPDFKAVRYAIRDLRIKLSRSGDTAWFFCILDDINEWKGQPANRENTRWTGVLEKRDGCWVMAQQHFSFETKE